MKIPNTFHRGLLALALILPACGFVRATLHGDGESVSERGGVLHVDDVPLRFERWAKLELAVDAGETLSLSTHTGPITLGASGVPAACALEVHVFSEVENDGVLTLKGGELTVRSDTAHRVIINGVRGGVPAGQGLELGSGTGEIQLTGLAGGGAVAVSSGTGRVAVEKSALGHVDVETGTGDISIRDVQAKRLDIETGTGRTQLAGCAAGELDFSSGTGDLDLDACRFQQSALESGTGDIRLLHGSSLGSETRDLGAGRVVVVPD